MSRITRVALVAALAMVVAACTQQEPEISVQEQVPADARVAEDTGEGEEGEPAEIAGESTWVAVDVDFAEFDTELPAGTVQLTLDNTGANLPHDITIEELGSRTVVEAAGGETATGTVTLEPGTYTFYCSVPGHRGTMEETVEVS
jgi:uncharacterized cupredoxin-like copper-binding protein